MKTRTVVLILALLAIASPVRADLFEITITSPNTTFDGVSTFNASANQATADSTGYVQQGFASGATAPALGTFASFVWIPSAGPIGGDFSLQMNLTSITATQADATGSFTFTDVDGDTITADLMGVWKPLGSSDYFAGTLSNVYWNDNGAADGTFDGGTAGSMPMGFSSPMPWNGTIVHLTTTAPWFSTALRTGFDVTGGSMDIHVVPVPAAVLLGVLGLGAAGIKLRRFV